MWLKVMLVSLFGWSSILSAVQGGVASVNRLATGPLDRFIGEGELDIEGVCSKFGMACQNSTFAVTCISMPVGWLKMPLEHCVEGQTCDTELQKCSKNPKPEYEAKTTEYHHSCEQIGIFPDAYDCRKFHICSPPDDLPYGRPAVHRVASCPRNYGYDVETARCSNHLENDTCTTTYVPNCTTVGQTDSLQTTYKYYYVCLSKNGNLYPQIFVCPHDLSFYSTFCSETNG